LSIVSGLGCFAAWGLVALAQGPAPVQPTFSGGTTLIEVAAVVTAGGQAVNDLRRDEVQVLDDGVPQPLVAFEYVDLTTVTGPPQRRDFVLVLDDLQIDPRTTKPAQDVALALIDLLGANDRLAIVNTSPHELRQQFSVDRGQARALVRKLRGQQGAPIPQVWEYNTRRLLDVLNSVATALKGDAPERRTVVVVSEGRLALDPERDTDRDMLQDYRAVVRAAALSNIVVHGIDPRGLLAPQPAPATQGTSVDAVRGSAENRAASNAARRFGALGLLAGSTGGRMVVDHNAPDAGLAQVIRDSRQYYRLAYVQPGIPAAERSRPRTITVRVSRDDVQVRARSAYVPR